MRHRRPTSIRCRTTLGVHTGSSPDDLSFAHLPHGHAGQAVGPSLAYELDELRKQQRRRRAALSKDQQAFRGSPEHLPPRTCRGKAHLRQLLDEWVVPQAEKEAHKWKRRKRQRASWFAGGVIAGSDTADHWRTTISWVDGSKSGSERRFHLRACIDHTGLPAAECARELRDRLGFRAPHRPVGRGVRTNASTGGLGAVHPDITAVARERFEALTGRLRGLIANEHHVAALHRGRLLAAHVDRDGDRIGRDHDLIVIVGRAGRLLERRLPAQRSRAAHGRGRCRRRRGTRRD